MRTVCEKDKCVGCMACIDICPQNAISVKDDLSVLNAVISEDQCVNCGSCFRVCQNNNPPITLPPIQWYQGWSTEPLIRSIGSSGGVASAISKYFISNGGVTCSCVFKNGRFIFDIAESLSEVEQFSGSKYIKSNPEGIYKIIHEKLKKKIKVLFIGLPCQVAALKNYVENSLQTNLYTVDLICHGTPSPRLLQLFLAQYGYNLTTSRDIKFRIKNKFQIYEGYQSVVTTGVCDRYSIAFLDSLIYTENCYNCLYAKQERVSDLTLGDSWGTTLTIDESSKGISLILCQTDRGEELIKRAKIYLTDVDIKNAVVHNHQLKEPSIKPVKRTKFFEGIKEGKSFNLMVFKCLPRHCVRQMIKELLIRMKFLGGGNLSYQISVKQ